ncbi:MAG: DNA polymerase Y family protein [Armatimonadota bacterium]|nr:DNA polymerase Y family protein [Armatimonadota bacterium]
MACTDVRALPLQILLRAHPEWQGCAVAVVEEDAPHSPVLWVNERARRAGILPGLRYATALSLAHDLRAGAVSASEVAHTIETLAVRLRRFAPGIEPSAAEPGVFWLDGSGLDLLYPSPADWARAVRQDLQRVGFRASVAVGFTRFGTYAVARSHDGVIVFDDPYSEQETARRVRLAELDTDPDLRDALDRLGVRTVDDFLRLPLEGVRERFGPQAHRLHQMASGDLPAPLRPLPEVRPVQRRLVLDNPETDRTRLLFAIKRLLAPMLAALGSRGQALVELELRLRPDGARWRTHNIRPASPTLDELRILDLVRLRLESEVGNRGSVGYSEIVLTARGTDAPAEQVGFFPAHPHRDLEAADRALARLRTEFGEAAVVRAVVCDGHLPEAQFAWEPIDAVTLPRPGVGMPAAVRRIFSKPIPLPSPPRDVRDDGWLILGVEGGAVTDLWGPYVVSGGWWRREVHREYYFVRTKRGHLLWVYYDRVRRRWFWHGRVE